MIRIHLDQIYRIFNTVSKNKLTPGSREPVAHKEEKP
jgi:hypothetical protein